MCKEGDLEVIDRLLDMDPQRLHVVDGNRRTLLHRAAYYGHIDLIDLLLEKGKIY